MIVSKEDKISNPLENKTFEEMVSLNNNFDTDELFGNTKIVPNKSLTDEKSLFDDIESKVEDTKKWESKLEILEKPTLIEEVTAPVFEEPLLEETEDLFKEESNVEEVTVEEKVEDVQEETDAKEPSIYDILENNKNIIWKTTDAGVSKNSIPVIGNNNLKPEILDNKKVNDITFPKLDGKDGEILWKETL